MQALSLVISVLAVAMTVVVLVMAFRIRRQEGRGFPLPRFRPTKARFSFIAMVLTGLAALGYEVFVAPMVMDTSWLNDEPPNVIFDQHARYLFDGILIYLYVWLLARLIGVWLAAGVSLPVAIAFNPIFNAVPSAFIFNPLAAMIHAPDGAGMADRIDAGMTYLAHLAGSSLLSDLDYMTDSRVISDAFRAAVEEPHWFASYAVAAIAAAALVGLGWSSSAVSLPAFRKGGTSSASGSGGRNMKEHPHEVTRLALAHAVTAGVVRRQQLKERLQYRYRGRPPEPGLDIGLLQAVLDRMLARDRKWRIFFVLCVAAALAGFLIQSVLLLILPLLAGTIGHIVKSHAERFRLRRMFRAARFNPENVRGHYGIEAGEEAESVNVMVYKGYLPFEFAGETTSRVAFTVDLSRGKDGGQSHDVKLGQLYQAVTGSVQQSGDYAVQDIALVHGEDAAGIREILPHELTAPEPHVGMEVMAKWFGSDDNRIRHYKWITAESWGRQLVVSYFLRFHISGSVLHAETTQCVMTPPDDSWRAIDREPPMTFSSGIAWFYGALLFAPIGVLASAGYGLAKTVEAINLVFVGGRDGLARRRIRQNPNHNYGADPSIRSEMASQAYLHYYQRMDSELYEKALARRILDTTIDFLESRDVDVSTLKESRTTIINSGVLVQGGDVTAQSLAVGQNARSAVGGGASKGGGSK